MATTGISNTLLHSSRHPLEVVVHSNDPSTLDVTAARNISCPRGAAAVTLPTSPLSSSNKKEVAHCPEHLTLQPSSYCSTWSCCKEWQYIVLVFIIGIVWTMSLLIMHLLLKLPARI